MKTQKPNQSLNDRYIELISAGMISLKTENTSKNEIIVVANDVERLTLKTVTVTVTYSEVYFKPKRRTLTFNINRNVYDVLLLNMTRRSNFHTSLPLRFRLNNQNEAIHVEPYSDFEKRQEGKEQP